MILTNMAITSTEKELVGANIRRFSEDAGVSLSRMASDLEMNRSYLHDILNGTANVTFDMLQRIAAYLSVSVRDLLTEPRKRKEKVGAGR